MGQALPSRLPVAAYKYWIIATLWLPRIRRRDAGVRRIGTGLFQPGPSLYKARAARGRMFPFNLLLREADTDDHSLTGQGNNLDMAVALTVVVPVKDEAEN